ncbi:MAG: PQQ-dependent sugar dehydrogenase [Planctomycetes bacterium]|nr:PQQ-dependent sugar dehydrogenase [Planctomycetota bacterium]
MNLRTLLPILILVASCPGAGTSTAAEPPQVGPPVPDEGTVTAIPPVTLVPALPRLSFVRPVQLVHADDGTNRVFVVEQPGRVRVTENDPEIRSTRVFLDIKSKVRMRHNEEGLLTLAFHPKYRENGQLFVYYTASKPRRGVLSRLRVSAENPDHVDPSTEEVILEVDQPYGNHNGGTIRFGPDGFLYLSLGDGGYANDPHGNGQKLSTLLGAVLRLDVDRTDGRRPYAIPADNPFVGRDGARGEIWAYGLRNLWRMSFDAQTGELWGADVGQNRWEEIDLITKGGNYGWNIREGRHDFRGGQSDVPLVDPIVEYSRDEGISVTGGVVYRGTKQPSLVGVYLYADYATGRIWGLRHEGGTLVASREIGSEARRKHVTSFDVGPDGEIYVCAFQTIDGQRGRVYRVDAR